jgi:hypothetical protein
VVAPLNDSTSIDNLSEFVVFIVQTVISTPRQTAAIATCVTSFGASRCTSDTVNRPASTPFLLDGANLHYGTFAVVPVYVTVLCILVVERRR